jgi:flagellar biosynthetic protein FliO
MAFEQSIAVLVVMAILAAALWLLRKKGLATVSMSLPRAFAKSRRMEVLERISLTAHHSLHLVRIDNRLIVIGVSPSSCGQIESLSQQADALRAEGALG